MGSPPVGTVVNPQLPRVGTGIPKEVEFEAHFSCY